MAEVDARCKPGVFLSVSQNRGFAVYLVPKEGFGNEIGTLGFHAMPHGIVGTRVKAGQVQKEDL
jgi:hypothetical protein